MSAPSPTVVNGQPLLPMPNVLWMNESASCLETVPVLEIS